MIGIREVSVEQTNLANSKAGKLGRESKQIEQRRKSLWLGNKDTNNNKSFQGFCDTLFAWQLKLDLCFAGWVLPFIVGIGLFTCHMWPFELSSLWGENASAATI